MERVIGGLEKKNRVLNEKRAPHRRVPRVRAHAGRLLHARRRSGAEGLDRAARPRRARLHPAGAARGPLPDVAATSCSAASARCSAAAPPRRSCSAQISTGAVGRPREGEPDRARHADRLRHEQAPAEPVAGRRAGRAAFSARDRRRAPHSGEIEQADRRGAARDPERLLRGGEARCWSSGAPARGPRAAAARAGEARGVGPGRDPRAASRRSATGAAARPGVAATWPCSRSYRRSRCAAPPLRSCLFRGTRRGSMEKRRLGRTGMRAAWRSSGAAFALAEAADSTRGFELALARGVNHLDIAPRYGAAESSIGRSCRRCATTLPRLQDGAEERRRRACTARGVAPALRHRALRSLPAPRGDDARGARRAAARRRRWCFERATRD